MSANVRNFVRRQTMDLTLPEREGALALQDEIHRIATDRLLPAMDELLSSLSPSREVIQLERVEIDLGDLSAGGLEQEIVEGTCGKLAEVLAKEIEALCGAPASTRDGARILSAEASDLELLRTFLLSGAVPWWAPGGTSVDPEALLEGLLETAPARVADLLRGHPASGFEIRILKQFSPGLRRRLRSVLAAAADGDVELVMLHWQRLLPAGNGGDAAASAAADDSLDLPPTGGLDMGQLVEAAVLRLLADGPEGRATVPRCCEQMVALLVREAGGGVAGILARLDERSRQALPADSGVRGWIEAQMRRNAASRPRRTAEPGTDEGPPGGQGDDRAGPDPHTRASARAGNGYPRDQTSAGVEPVTRRQTGPPSADHGAEPLTEPGILEPGASRTPPRPPGPPDRASPGTGPMDGEADESARTGSEPPAESPLEGEDQYIDNAGLVLVWPYLTPFFATLGLLEDKLFRSEPARERAVLLLQHLATAEAAWPEPALLLNKILCGWPHEEPVARSIEIGERELVESRELIASVIENWQALKGTSVQGLRSSFLQREGHLLRVDEGWRLKVARTGYDVLLDRLPWGIGFVLLPWMKQPLYVEW